MTNSVVAITAPSLDASKNVSGISSVAKVIMGVDDYRFVHYQVGSQDSEGKGVRWALSQLSTFIRFPGFLLLNKVNLLHLNTALNPLSIWRDLLLAIIARLVCVRVLVHLHGGRYLADDCDSPVNRLGIKALLGCATRIAVLSDAEVALVRQRGYSSSLNIAVLTNSIDLAEIPKFESRSESDVTRLIFLGRFHESKGLAELEAATSILKTKGVPFTFSAYGSGPEQQSFCSYLENLLGADFAYGGVVSGEAKWSALLKADVFLLPSRHGEGLPMAMLEAMAMGLCVIVTDLASIGSVVKNGVNGFMVPKMDGCAIAEVIEGVVGDAGLRSLVGKNAAITVRTHFSAEDYRVRVSTLYGQLLA